MLNQAMRALIEENTLGLVATVTPDGRPAVSPKATTVVIDDRHLAFSNLRSPNTVRNIRANPAVELNFIDVFRRQACRVAGTARYVERGDARFEELLPMFATWHNLVERMQGFVEVDVSDAELVLSPAYDDGAAESDLVEHWLAYYRERHAFAGSGGA